MPLDGKSPPQDIYAYLNRKILALEKEVARLNRRRPQMFGTYDLTNNPPTNPNATEITIDKTDELPKYYYNGDWHTFGGKAEDWHNVGDTGEPAFEDSWTNIGGSYVPARFRLNGDGEVEIAMAVKDGDAGTTIFTLPTDYRPQYAIDFAVTDGAGGVTTVTIDTDGSVNWVG